MSSELVRMECLVKPMRLSAAAVVADFEDFFTNRVTDFAPFTRAVFERATRIRVTYNFKTPDSLHLAVATEAGYDVFVTNDGRLSAYTDIRIDAI